MIRGLAHTHRALHGQQCSCGMVAAGSEYGKLRWGRASLAARGTGPKESTIRTIAGDTNILSPNMIRNAASHNGVAATILPGHSPVAAKHSPTRALQLVGGVLVNRRNTRTGRAWKWDATPA